jgi:nitroimidazol reductase NimA-like FMN-containing flavoprotein (pyridoxamine 5'-phosphate oxidase superfamily)
VEVVSGPWDRDRVTAWLEQARIPVRLAVLATRGPLVVSLWYRFDGEALWCATRDTADVVAHVRGDPRVGIEVAGDLPPYRGVRGTGRVELRPDAGVDTLEALLARYLDARNAVLADQLRTAARRGEVALRITALRLTSWDFSGRMRAQAGDAVLPAP